MPSYGSKTIRLCVHTQPMLLCGILAVMGLGACTQAPVACAQDSECFALETCQAGQCVPNEDPVRDMSASTDFGTPPGKDMARVEPPDMAIPPAACGDQPCEKGWLCDKDRQQCVECVEDADCKEPTLMCVESRCQAKPPAPFASFDPEGEALFWRHVHSNEEGSDQPAHFYATDPFTVSTQKNHDVQGDGSISTIDPQIAQGCQWSVWLCRGESPGSVQSSCEDAVRQLQFPEQAIEAGAAVTLMSDSLEEFSLPEGSWQENPYGEWVIIVRQQCDGFDINEVTRLRSAWIAEARLELQITDPVQWDQ
jgi:hypothetical protein